MEDVAATTADSIPLEVLEHKLTSRATEIAAAEAEWMEWLAEYDRRRGWVEWGCIGAAHWLSWKCGLSPSAARERVRVANALPDLPLVRAEFGEGRLSYSKVQALTRVANEHNENHLVALAVNTTGAQLAKICAGLRSSTATDEAAGHALTVRHWRTRPNYDGTTDIVIRVSDADAMQARQHVECEAQTIIDEAVATRQAYHSFAVDNWGNGRLSALFTGRRVSDDELEMLARQERRVFSPGAMGRYLDREWDADVREVLPMIQSPTLVLHRANNQLVDPGQGRYITEHIPGARHVEVQGSAHVPFHGDTEPLLAEIREFLTGHREAARVDRVLATILFTDIVDSTRQAADLGDHRWRQLLDEHDAATAAAVERFDGRVVKSTGDGALATFASPGRAIAAAKAIAATVERSGLQIRAGLHTGECELRGDDVGGIAVHIAARVAALAGPGQLLVSRTVTDLVVGADMTFADAGEHELKGVPGTWALFSVE